MRVRKWELVVEICGSDEGAWTNHNRHHSLTMTPSEAAFLVLRTEALAVLDADASAMASETRVENLMLRLIKRLADEGCLSETGDPLDTSVFLYCLLVRASLHLARSESLGSALAYRLSCSSTPPFRNRGRT